MQRTKTTALRTAAKVANSVTAIQSNVQPGLSAANRPLVPANVMPVWQQGSLTILDSLPRGSQDTCSNCCNRVQRFVSAAVTTTGSCLPMRHRTDPDNFTKETETKENAIAPRKSLRRNGFWDCTFCDFHGNRVETNEFATGETISIGRSFYENTKHLLWLRGTVKQTGTAQPPR